MTVKPKSNPGRRRRRGRLLEALALLAALLPTAAVAWSYLEGESPTEAARRRVLASLERDPTVLINVTSREMPGSPDILNLGKRSTPALQRCLSDNVDASLRRLCAALLGQLGDRRALPTLQTALEAWEPEVRLAAVLALRQLPDRGSFAPLMKLFARNDEEESNRLAILTTLGALSSPQAVQVLRKELRKGAKDDDEEGAVDRRATAFDALWRSRHLMARSTLVDDVGYALRSGNPALVAAATAVSAELRAPQLVRHLTPLLENQRPDIRNKAVYALGRIGDRSATRALLAALPKVREARMLNNIAFALERLDRAAFFDSIREVLGHKQAIIRLNAAFVLGDVKRPEGVPLLAKALADPSDYVRTSAIVALGKLKTAEAAKLIEPFVKSDNASIRQEAIYALHALSGGKRADLIYGKLFTLRGARHAAMRHRAAIVLGQAGDTRVREYLLTCLEQRRCRRDEVADYLRADRAPQTSGRVLLGWTQGRSELTELVSELKPAGSLPLALSVMDAYLARNRTSLSRADAIMGRRAIDLVGGLGDAKVQGRLRPHLSPAHAWLRVHTAVALARLGDQAADTRLLGDLDNFPVEWLPRMAALLGRISEAPARGRLLGELQKREKDAPAPLALAAAAVHLRWDPERAFFRFLDALASAEGRERDLAERYLRRDRSPLVTSLLRRALARESRESTRDRLRQLLDAREQS